MIGKTFGKLTIISLTDPHITNRGFKHKRYLCKCECGREIKVIIYSLLRGNTKSCGCLKKENSGMREKFKNNVGRTAIHDWVKSRKGFPKKCEMCGSTTKKTYDWANKDHKYLRKLEDYMCLCRGCHREYDKKHNHYVGACVTGVKHKYTKKHPKWFKKDKVNY